MSKPTDDDRLRDEVERRLAEDFLIDESKFDVEVSEGLVTLVGTVGTYAEKVVAQATVRSTPGVHDLVNAVTVKPIEVMNPSDAQLARMVDNVLAWDALVPERDLKVSVRDGVVTLGGTCPTAIQLQEAERAVSHIGGVRNLINEVEVVGPELETSEIRELIAEVLTRRALHQAARLHIVVDGRDITLAGPTQSAMEKRAIVGAVSHADQVGNVRDELTVTDDVEPTL